jgi:hypothetical protein
MANTVADGWEDYLIGPYVSKGPVSVASSIERSIAEANVLLRYHVSGICSKTF